MSEEGGGNRRFAVRVRNTRGTVLSETEIDRFPLVIGRGREGETDVDADIAVDDPRCSRSHVLIEREADGIWLTDQGSTNGTFSSDGKRVTKVRLRNRTRIRIGSHWLEFRIEADEDCTLVDSEPLPSPPPSEPEPASKEAEEESPAARKVSRRRDKEESDEQDRRPRVRGVKAGPDLLDRLQRVASSRITASVILALSCARVGYWQSGSVMWKVTAVFGTILFTIAAATVLAALSVLFAKLLSNKPPKFVRVRTAYVSLVAAQQLFAWLTYDAMLIWPAQRYLEPWVPMLGMLLFGLYCCFNARWILSFGPRRVSAFAVLWSAAMLLMYLPELKPQPPLWLRVVETPVLNSQPRRLPASVQVPEEQFLHELSESMVALQEKK